MRRAGGWLVGVCLALGAATAFADEGRVTLELKDGKQVEGTLLGFGERTFRVEVDGRVEEFRESQIVRIEFATAAEPRPDSPPERAGPRPVHRAPVDVEIRNEPGELTLLWSRSIEDEYVLTTYEIWQQLKQGEWERVGAPEQVGDTRWSQRGTSTPRRFKVVSLAQVDRENPVVDKYDLILAAKDRRQESSPTDWIVPNTGVELLPVMLLDAQGRGARAYVRVTKWDVDGERWTARGFVVPFGVQIGGVVDGVDYSTGLTLLSARIEERRGPRGSPTVLVLVTESADGDTREWTDSLSGGPTRGRLRVVEPPATPARERIQTALTDRERRVDIRFLSGTSWSDALDYLRQVTGLNLVADPAVDVDSVQVQASLRQARLADALRLLFELGGFEAAPYCETLYVAPKGERPDWQPSRAAVDSEQGKRLQEVVVSADWSALPFEEATEIMGEVSGLNMVLTPQALELVHEEALEVELRVEAVQLINLLTLSVRRHEELAWTVRHGAVVIFATGEDEEWSVERATDLGEALGDQSFSSGRGAALDREQARAKLSELADRLRANPADPRLHVARGRLLRGGKDLDAARAEFERAIELNPQSTNAWLGRAACRRDQGELEGALEDLREALALDPRRVSAVEGLAVVSAELGLTDEAREAAQALTLLAANDGEVWATLARVELVLKDNQGAAMALLRAAELLPAGHVGLAVTRGWLAIELSQPDQAVSWFTAALEHEPRQHEAWIGRAYARRAQGYLAGALEDYSFAIGLDSEGAEGWLGRGVLRIQLGDYVAGIEDLRRATALEPRRAEAWFHLGQAYAQAGDGTAAMQAFNGALVRDPKLARVHLERAVLWVQTGQFDEAERDVLRALELEPGLAERAKQVRNEMLREIERVKSGR